MKQARVYRLLIAYPAGSDDPKWTPACWEALLSDMPAKWRRSARARGFRWPRERMFLSAGSAYHRALLLQWFGAVVAVQASEPVTWWEDTDGADWSPDDEDEELQGWLDEAARFSQSDLPASQAEREKLSQLSLYRAPGNGGAR
jgi:hypothetical protein